MHTGSIIRLSLAAAAATAALTVAACNAVKGAGHDMTTAAEHNGASK